MRSMATALARSAVISPVENKIEESYVAVFNGATLKDESTSLRFLTPDVALVDVDGVITGATNGTVRHHVASIYVKRNGKWTMMAERATNKQ